MSCTENLNTAWLILQEIKRSKGNPLAGPAFQFALIEYSKPYRCSHGTIKKYKLNDEHVPVNYREMHTKILNARDKIHAHSDLTVKEAKLYYSKIEDAKYVSTVQNIIHGTEELPNIGAIIDLIEQTLDSMYGKAKQLEAALPPIWGED
ncbi:MAG: hypothetical protein HZB83_00940 [Deltaproteobacteria bacterium]|nr:hypothetical protein [Deltaproteobacteria bacterium]